MFDKRVILVVSSIFLLSLTTCGEEQGLLTSYWSVESAQDHLDVTIPHNATDIIIGETPERTGEREAATRAGNLYISFTSPTISLSDFTDNICNGTLYEGFDPFRSTFTDSPEDNSILIKDVNPHYSRSQNISDKLKGNRCRAMSGYIHEISVETIGEGVSIVRFQQYGACFQMPNFPCTAVADFVEPVPNTELPLMVLGLEEIAGEYVVNYTEICIEIRSGYYPPVDENGIDPRNPYTGSEVFISIDNDEMPEGVVIMNSRGNFLIQQTDTVIDEETIWWWSYCLPTDFGPGTHDVIMILVNQETLEVETFEWSFLIEG